MEKDAELMFGVLPDVEDGTIELMDHRAMVTFPEESVEVTMNVKVFHDGELMEVHKKLDMGEIREAFRKADNGYIDEDDRFVLTDKGKAYLEELNQSI